MAIPVFNLLFVHCHILVVEDEYFIADDMAKALEQLGADVVGPARNQGEALALLSSGEGIDAAVHDINLRGLTVFPIADALIEQGVPFVFVAGYARFSSDKIPRWEKPFNPIDLAKTLPQLLRDAR
jgi:CheY-like chemotaxis protein